MTAPPKEAEVENRVPWLARSLVELADNLRADFDIAEHLDRLVGRCVELLDAAAAGVMLADGEGGLRLMASSTERLALRALFDLQGRAGPHFDCYRNAEPIVNQPLDGGAGRWPAFGTAAQAEGIGTVHAVPMRHGDEVIGVLASLHAGARELGPAEIALVEALADVATIAIIQERTLRRTVETTGQLQHALDSRIVIEQAKGMVAERLGIDMQSAFEAVRGHARAHNRHLADVAGDIVERHLGIDRLRPIPSGAGAPPSRPGPAGDRHPPGAPHSSPAPPAPRPRRLRYAEPDIPRSA